MDDEPGELGGDGPPDPPIPSSPVLQAKLRPAVNPGYLLPRPRLNSLVDEAVVAPLTLVVAPAGSGKTSLLRSWVAETQMPHAWLSLDDIDRDPVQLWSGVLAALEEIAPGCAAPAAGLLRRPGGLSAAIGALLDDLEEREYEPRVLVIDDLQLVDDEEAISSSLAVFVQHLPVWLRLVVASRRTPRLPVHRLRARGQLGEVRFSELRFSLDEAAAMLSRIAPGLPEDRVTEVAARAGGWAASIQLAALAARSSRAQAIVGVPVHDDRLLEDYVWQEVLSNEREDVLEVLLATSVVDRIDPGLGQALAGRADAPALLATAEERGLFVTRIEPSGSFEVHVMVREVLTSLSEQRWPGRLAELHGRAAAWYESNAEVVLALEHWLRADRPRDALRLLSAEVASLYDSGRESTIRRTIESIPAAVASTDMQSMLEFAWCHLLVDRHRFLQAVDYVSAWAIQEPDLDVTHRARLLVLRSIAGTLRGASSDGADLARQALDALGGSWLLDPLGKFAWNMVARDIALSERWDDTGAEVRAVVGALSVAPERRIAFEGTRALGLALGGYPVDALRVVAGARKASEVASMTILRTELGIAEAIATREIGDASAALPALLELADSRVEPVPYARLLASVQVTQARIDDGDLDAAADAFGRAIEQVDTELSGPGGRDLLARTGVVLALASDELDDARGWASQVADPFWSGLCRARIQLRCGEYGDAAGSLEAAEPRCVLHHTIHELLLWRATRDPQEAGSHLLDAVRTATGHGLVQTVASEGYEVVEAVERLAWQTPQSWLARLRRAVAPGTAAKADHSLVLVESLTDRELEVLRLLPSRLTLREISDELFISMNTLKFHLKVIYRKLGCGSRAEAAEMARAVASLRRTGHPSSTRRR